MAKNKLYKLVGSGSRNTGEVVDRIILSGSSHEPESYIDANTPGELSEEQVAQLRASGHTLREVSEEKAPASSGSPESKTQQQAAQAPSTGTSSKE